MTSKISGKESENEMEEFATTPQINALKLKQMHQEKIT